MYSIISEKDLSKFDTLFPEFEILPEPPKEQIILDKCIEKLKLVKVQDKKEHIIFDIHTAKLKKMEYLRSMKKIIYEDDLEKINKQCKNSFSKFFKK